MYQLLMKPIFWGHMARHHNSANSKNGYKYGRWIYDESESAPEGVLLFRNTHPPVWEGELADCVRQEIDRRHEHMRGKAVPHYTHRLSGIAICGECGHFMATRVDGDYHSLRCPASAGRPRLPKCGNRSIMNERRIIARIDEFLRQMLRENTTNIFEDTNPDSPRFQERITALAAEIDELERQARALIRKQLSAIEDIQNLYDEELQKIGIQLKNMKDGLSRLQGESLAAQQTTAVQQATLEELADLTLEKFWLQESRVINQMLHRIMGNRRLVILNKEVIGVAISHRTQRRRN
jgi:hypothetical protein